MTDQLIHDIEAAHILALHTDRARVTVDCGHLARPGLTLMPDWRRYADTPGEGVTGWPGYARERGTDRKICPDCAHSQEVEAMRSADKYTAYLSADRRRVTDWPGGKLGSVTSYSESTAARKCYVRVTDVHGNEWHGTGPLESGTYVSLRRVKGKH